MIKTCSIKTLTHEISDCWIEPEFDWNFPRHTHQVTLTDEKKTPQYNAIRWLKKTSSLLRNKCIEVYKTDKITTRTTIN